MKIHKNIGQHVVEVFKLSKYLDITEEQHQLSDISREVYSQG